METLNDLIIYLISPIGAVLLIMGLAELCKRTGLESKWIPALDVVMGLCFGLTVYTWYQGFHPVEGVLVGLALGLSACGLFSGIKNTLEK